MSNTTCEKLKSMHLGAMAQAYEQQLTDPRMDKLTFEERMAMLTDIEYTSRKNNRLDRLVRQATFDQPQAHLAEIDYSPRRELNRDLVLRLGSCDFINEARNIIIMGAAGSGKTYLACALGMEACKQFFGVKFVRMPTLLEDFHLAEATGTLRKLYKDYAKVGLLILDDWMLVRLTPEESRFIYEIVHRRHKAASTVYCSQFAPAGWHQRISEETLADAILDRIVYDSYAIEIKSLTDMPSMREKYGLHSIQH
ncbi:MAG: IS21-like element helper ATPase IstB [Saccharofermentanales bacterium]